jgi:hypothetical protein
MFAGLEEYRYRNSNPGCHCEKETKRSRTFPEVRCLQGEPENWGIAGSGNWTRDVRFEFGRAATTGALVAAFVLAVPAQAHIRAGDKTGPPRVGAMAAPRRVIGRNPLRFSHTKKGRNHGVQPDEPQFRPARRGASYSPSAHPAAVLTRRQRPDIGLAGGALEHAGRLSSSIPGNCPGFFGQSSPPASFIGTESGGDGPVGAPSPSPDLAIGLVETHHRRRSL